MAIARMSKVIIVSFYTEASELLEKLQHEGICQILNAEEAMVSKDSPDLAVATRRPRDIEELLQKLRRSIAFLDNYSDVKKGLTSVLSPRVVVNEKLYNDVVSDEQIFKIINQCEQLESSIERLRSECESLRGTLEQLSPWQSLQTPVEEISQLQQTICLAGLLPVGHFENIQEQLSELTGAIQQVGAAGNRFACLVVCLKGNASEVQKLLRSAEFEPVNFGTWTGTITELIKKHTEKLKEAKNQLNNRINSAAALTENLLKLQILLDHYENLLKREQAKDNAPATQHAVFLEGWVKEHDYPRLEKIVSSFGASSVTKVEPAEGEEMPVEIENKTVVKPFEVITRLYGMPHHLNVDPTVYLAPFFAVFFGMCLADAGYGLIMVVLTALLTRKMQGDKKLIMMLGLCGAATIVIGALTGGWFGDAVQQFVPALKPLREKLMWFDPLDKPMYFFAAAVGLGYFQIQTGLVIALVHSIKQKDYASALFNKLTWLVMLNSVLIFGVSKAGYIPPHIGSIFGKVAIVPAAMIFLFSHREGGLAARLGMGFYNLFSSIFYLGDVLSYLRLMALGMVGAGLAMAINVIAGISYKIPVIGILVMILVLVGGHLFNLVLAVLSAFVHTLRLQYVEFFPKFLVGGGRSFEPLNKKYEHIYVTKEI